MIKKQTNKLPTLTKDGFTVYFMQGLWYDSDEYMTEEGPVELRENVLSFASDELVMFSPVEVITCLEESLDWLECEQTLWAVARELRILQ